MATSLSMKVGRDRRDGCSNGGDYKSAIVPALGPFWTDIPG